MSGLAPCGSARGTALKFPAARWPPGMPPGASGLARTLRVVLRRKYYSNCFLKEIGKEYCPCWPRITRSANLSKASPVGSRVLFGSLCSYRIRASASWRRWNSSSSSRSPRSEASLARNIAGVPDGRLLRWEALTQMRVNLRWPWPAVMYRFQRARFEDAPVGWSEPQE